MELAESTVHSFVVRIWLEEAAEGGNPAVWRGYVVHALDGNRLFLDDLTQITAFIQPYLERMGVAFGPRRR